MEVIGPSLKVTINVPVGSESTLSRLMPNASVPVGSAILTKAFEDSSAKGQLPDS